MDCSNLEMPSPTAWLPKTDTSKKGTCALWKGISLLLSSALAEYHWCFSVVGCDPEKMPSTSSYPLELEYPALSVITIAIEGRSEDGPFGLPSPRMGPRKKTELTLLGKVERKFQRKNARIIILVLWIDYRCPTIEVFHCCPTGTCNVKKIVHQNVCQTILTGRNDTCSKESGCVWSHSKGRRHSGDLRW